MNEPIVAVFSGGGTGGHLYPALALAGALVERRPDVVPFFVGAERGVEARVYRDRGLPHLLLPVEGVRRGTLLGNLRGARLLVGALAEVAGAFRRLRPHLVVVTGGYAGGPAGVVAALTGVRLVLQEQNSVPGLTTRALSLFACEVHLAFPEAADGLPRRARSRVRVSGNPVRPPAAIDREGAARALTLDPARPILLVVGGSQGSEALNTLVLEAVEGVVAGRLLRSGGVQLYWATGPTHLENIQAALRALGSPDWVRALGYIEEMPMALAAADLALSRAGAMATSEFLALGLPAILVPLPTAAADHQTRNAEALAEAGAALHLPQVGADGTALWAQVTGLLDRPEARERMSVAARARGRPDAAREIARALDALLPPPPPLTTGKERAA